MRRCCVSVDLDSLPHYCRIHGLPETLLDARARALVYRTAVRRLLELFSRFSVKATFFAIGEDLAEEAAAGALAEAHRGGVEVGNHSHGHDYALARKPREAIEAEVAQGEHAIRQAVGQAPVGFRAPGYTLSPALYDVLCARGYLYDSSTFPAAPYYAAKALVMGALWAFGRPSRAILDSPRVLLAPREPYLPRRDDPYRRGSGPVLELPIATTPGARLPFIGTFATAFPRPVVRAAYRTLRGADFFNFELHAIDVLDADDGVPQVLVQRQRDLSIPHTLKLARLASVLKWLVEDYRPMSLAEAARQLGPRPGAGG